MCSGDPARTGAGPVHTAPVSVSSQGLCSRWYRWPWVGWFVYFLLFVWGVFGKGLGVLHFPPSPLALCLPPLQAVFCPEARDLIETSCLDQNVPSSLVLCMLSGCGSLCAFPSAAGGSFCDVGWAGHWPMRTAGCGQESFYCYLGAWVVSGSGSPKQCHVWAPANGMGLK